MPTQDGILTVILVAIVANLVVAVGLLAAPRFRARRHDGDERAEINRTLIFRAQGLGGSYGAGAPWPATENSSAAFGQVNPTVGEPQMAMASADLAADRPTDGPAGDAGEGGDLDDAGDGDLDDSKLTDALPRFDGPATWSKRLTEENARIQRYGRTATVVLIELAGLDRLAERLGPAAAERLIPPLATTMRRQARSADSLARLGPNRFGALLPDTDEVKAINYVERVRSACDVWLEAGAVSLRLSIGWAEISVNQPVDPAILAAERRLNEERQRLRGRDVDRDEDLDVVAAQVGTPARTRSGGRARVSSSGPGR